MQSGLPADAASLRETGSVDRLYRCNVLRGVLSDYALADGADREGLHFSASAI